MPPPKRNRREIALGLQTTSSPCAGWEASATPPVETPTTRSQQIQDFDNRPAIGKPDYSTYDYKHVWGIFSPLCNVANQDIFVATWNIQHPAIMESVIRKWHLAKNVRILVGYNRSEHNLDKLAATIRDYQVMGFNIRALPNFHAKIWGVGEQAWVGSCNFVPNTIHNYMVRTTWESVHDFCAHYWQNTCTFSKSTKLELLPQPTGFALKGM